jgi:hypothetical protein
VLAGTQIIAIPYSPTPNVLRRLHPDLRLPFPTDTPMLDLDCGGPQIALHGVTRHTHVELMRSLSASANSLRLLIPSFSYARDSWDSMVRTDSVLARATTAGRRFDPEDAYEGGMGIPAEKRDQATTWLDQKSSNLSCDSF